MRERPNPQSIDDWLRLCSMHERAALSVVDDKVAAGMAHQHAGFAVECALKAYIWRLERPNRWPDPERDPVLNSHNIRALKDRAKIVLSTRAPEAASWMTVLDWNRGQGYDPAPMPRKVARAMVDAAFGDEGVVTWLRRQLKIAS